MSAKTTRARKRWIKGKGGIYTRTPTRGPLQGEQVYCARVWVKSLGRFAHFILGTKLRKAEDKLHEIKLDPEKALEARKRRDVGVLTFGQLLDEFLAGYRSRGGTDYYHAITKAPREFLGDRPVPDVTIAALESYVKARESVQRKDCGGRRVSDSSIRKELIALGTVFRWTKRNGYATANAADRDSVRRPTETFDPQEV